MQHVIFPSLVVWFFLQCSSSLPALVYTWEAGKEMIVWVCEIFHVQLGKWPITGIFIWIKYVTAKYQGAEVKHCCGYPHYLSLILYGALPWKQMFCLAWISQGMKMCKCSLQGL